MGRCEKDMIRGRQLQVMGVCRSVIDLVMMFKVLNWNIRGRECNIKPDG